MAIRRVQMLGLLLLAMSTSLLAGVPTTAPATTQKAESEYFGAWSESVNGLQARLGPMEILSYMNKGFFLELKNTGTKPLTIPSLWVSAHHKGFPWRVQTLQGQDWQDNTWQVSDSEPADNTNPPAAEKPITLQPQQTALMIVEGSLGKFINDDQGVRFVVQQTDHGPITGWSGKLITPPAGNYPLDSEITPTPIPAPTYFPLHTRSETYIPNGVPFESQFNKLWSSNGGFSECLKKFQNEPIRRELEARLLQEKDFAMQLLLAREAAYHGSLIGQKIIQKSLQELDYDHLCSSIDALESLFEGDNTPAWVYASALAALQDDRKVNPNPEIHDPEIVAENLISVSKLANGGGGVGASLSQSLADVKYQPAVPVFIKILQQEPDRVEIISSLGEIGDPAAIPVLQSILKSEQNKIWISEEKLEPDNYMAALRSLVNLKAKGITEELLTHAATPEIIWLLEKQADPRIIPVLKQIVATGKAQKFTGANPNNDRACVGVAKIVLANLEPGDRVGRYCSLIQDQSLDHSLRRAVLERFKLKENHDPRIIPILLTIAQKGTDGFDITYAARLLGDYHQAEAVSGLIQLLQLKFEPKQMWKIVLTPDDFHKEVAESLTNITGQKLGTDPAAWQKWWDQQPKDQWK